MVRCAKSFKYRSPVCLSCFSRKTTPIFIESTKRFVRFTNISCPKCSSRVFEKHKFETYRSYSFPDTKTHLVYKLIKCNLDCSVIEANECSDELDKNRTDGLKNKIEVVDWDCHVLNQL